MWQLASFIVVLLGNAADVKYTHKKQSGGSGQYAEVFIKFMPGEKNSGFTFKSEIKGGSVPKEYIPGVIKGLEECMTSGALAGYPVVDLSATLYDGNSHDVDSSVLAFQIAARGAFREAMKKGKCKLMEPVMSVEVLTPEDHMGDVIGDLNSRRGMVEGFSDRPGGMKNVKARVCIPINHLLDVVESSIYSWFLCTMYAGCWLKLMALPRHDATPYCYDADSGLCLCTSATLMCFRG